MRVTNFDRPTIKQIKIDQRAVAALQSLADELGLTVDYGGGAFDATTFTVKLRFKVKDEAALATKERETFDRFAGLYGMTPADLGATFVTRGEEWVIIGVLPSRPKFPIRARHARTGEVKIFTTDVVRLIVRRVPAAA